jgi:hypothetical protein
LYYSAIGNGFIEVMLYFDSPGHCFARPPSLPQAVKRVSYLFQPSLREAERGPTSG